MSDTPIHTHGTVLQPMSAVLYQVALPNGKVILAHVSKRISQTQITFVSNDRVLLELTPFDFDTARILDLA